MNLTIQQQREVNEKFELTEKPQDGPLVADCRTGRILHGAVCLSNLAMQLDQFHSSEKLHSEPFSLSFSIM